MAIRVNLLSAPMFLKKVTDQEFINLEKDQGQFLLESVSLEELETTYQYGHTVITEPMFEAITSSMNKIDRTMAAFTRALNKHLNGSGISANPIVGLGKPRISGGFATLAVQMQLSDGQSVNVIFHSPSGDPSKIVQNDVLVAFRFLLNKADITAVVAPHGGTDLSLDQVCISIAKLAEKNSAKFVAKIEGNAAKKSRLEQLQSDIESTEQEYSESKDTLYTEKKQADNADYDIGLYKNRNKRLEENIAKLKQQIEALQNKKIPDSSNDNNVVPVAPTPDTQLTNDAQAAVDQFIKTMKNSASSFEKIITGQMPGMDKKLFAASIYNKFKTLVKNHGVAAADAGLAAIAETQSKMSGTMFTGRHGIWKLGSGDVTPISGINTKKPSVARKPKINKPSIEDKKKIEVNQNDPVEVEFSKIDVSSITGGNFGKTWHELGVENAQQLIREINIDPLITGEQRLDYLAKAQKYVVAQKLKDSHDIFGENATKYWYGLRARPFDLGVAPKGQTAILSHDEAANKFTELKQSSAIRHGAIAYAEKLTDEQISGFELVDINDLLNQQLSDNHRTDFLERLADNLAVTLDYQLTDELYAQFVEEANKSSNKMPRLMMKEIQNFSEFSEENDSFEYKRFEQFFIDEWTVENAIKVLDMVKSQNKTSKQVTDDYQVIADDSSSTGYSMNGKPYVKNGQSFRYDEEFFEYLGLGDGPEQGEIDQEIKLLDTTTGEAFRLVKGQSMTNDLIFEGFNDTKPIEQQIDEALEKGKKLIQDLDLSQYIVKGKLTFDGQDRIYEALVNAGVSTDIQVINNINSSVAQRVRDLLAKMINDGELVFKESESNSLVSLALKDLWMLAKNQYTLKDDILTLNTGTETITYNLKDKNDSISSIADIDSVIYKLAMEKGIDIARDLDFSPYKNSKTKLTEFIYKQLVNNMVPTQERKIFNVEQSVAEIISTKLAGMVVKGEIPLKPKNKENSIDKKDEIKHLNNLIGQLNGLNIDGVEAVTTFDGLVEITQNGNTNVFDMNDNEDRGAAIYELESLLGNKEQFEFEIASKKLKELIKGARLPKGWSFDKQSIDNRDYDPTVDIESPLFKYDINSSSRLIIGYNSDNDSFKLVSNDGGVYADDLKTMKEVMSMAKNIYETELVKEFAEQNNADDLPDDLKTQIGDIFAKTDTDTDNQNHGDNAKAMIDKLEIEIASSSDYEALYNLAESTMEQLESMGQLDEYEPIIEKAMMRVNELIEKVKVA